MIKHVFPQAKIKTFSPGTTRNLIVLANGEKVYEKKKEGRLDDAKSSSMISAIRTVATHK